MPIRRATSLDLPAIAALHIAIAAELRALAPEGYGRPLESMPGAGDVAGKFRDALDDSDALVLVAEVDGAVVGVGTGWVETHGDDLIEAPFYTIEYIEVHPDHRGNGLASELLSALEDDARRRGVSHIDLRVFVSNTGACKLYERFGYKPLEYRMGKALN
jgi:[ribosomal protein S18]-alanine N-acetyltransferase